MAEDGGKGQAPLLTAVGMREIEAQVRTCQLCRLGKTRTNAVPGEGNFGAEVMFIGEGPGYNEDKQGRPFVGSAGHFLTELLSIAGLSRKDVFIANVVKCRPPNNRDPNPDEIAACAPYLERQVALVNPRVIVTLGRYSMAKFFPGERISQIHGTARVVGGRICVAMYHPAAGLHQASLADVIRSDFRILPIYIEQARKMLAQPAPQAAQERVAQAEVAREQVTPEPETLAALEQDAVHESSPEYSPAAPHPPREPQAVEPGPTLQTAAAGPEKAAKKESGEGGEYKQLSLFDK